MSSDMKLIARGTPQGWTNLAIGEPKLVQAGLKDFYPDVCVPDQDHGYPRSSGDFDLIEKIRDFHKIKEQFIVLTSGAKQGLIAAMSASLKLGHAGVYSVQSPYWPSFPTLAAHAGLFWTDDNPDVMIDTWPNNPTGYALDCDNDKIASFIIRDEVYSSPIFDPQDSVELVLPEADVVVNSASKCYGLSGIRLGWASTDDREIAQSITEYVETTTSGVSSISQRYFDKFLNNIISNHAFFECACTKIRDNIRINGRVFETYLGRHVVDSRGVPNGDGGMFAWFKPRHPKKFKAALEKAKILMVDGDICGVPGYYRANMAEALDLTHGALKTLGEILE